LFFIKEVEETLFMILEENAYFHIFHSPISKTGKDQMF